MSDPTVVPSAPERPGILSIFVTVVICLFFGGALYVLAYHDLPANNKDALLTLTGLLGTAFTALVHRFIGDALPAKK